jgi:hypothetical protein
MSRSKKLHSRVQARFATAKLGGRIGDLAVLNRRCNFSVKIRSASLDCKYVHRGQVLAFRLQVLEVDPPPMNHSARERDQGSG